MHVIAEPDRAAASPRLFASGAKQWWMVAVLGALAMLSSIDRHVLSLLVKPIKADLMLSDTQMSLLLGLSFAAAYTLVGIPAGYLADRYSRRGIAGLGVVLWSLMTVLCGLSGLYWQLFTARALVGLGEGAILPAAASMVRDGVHPSRRGRAYAVLAMMPLAGTGASVLIGGALIAAITAHGAFHLPFVGLVQPWQMALVTVGVAGLPLALLAFTVHEPARIPTAPGAAPGGTYGDAMRHIGANWTLYGPLLVFAVMNGIISSLYGAWMPTLLNRSFGLSPAQIGATFGVLILFGAPCGLLLAGTLIDVFRKRHPYTGPALVGLVGLVLVGIPATIAPLLLTQSQFWPLFAVQVLMSGVPVGATQIMLANSTPSDRMGKVQGCYMLVTGLVGLATGPTLAALIADHAFEGPRALAFGMSSVSATCAVIAFLAGVVVLRTAARTARTVNED